MKSKLVLVAVGCLVVLAAAQQPGLKRERSRAEVYTLEGLGALGGGICCGSLCAALVVVGVASSMTEPGLGPWSMAAAGVALVSTAALPAAAGYGTALVGARLGEDGSRRWAIVGAYVGVPIAAVASVLGGNIWQDGYGQRAYWAVPVYVLGGLAIPAGAVVGYNLGTPSYSAGGRLELPGFALTSVELPDHSVEYGVKVQLAGLRF